MNDSKRILDYIQKHGSITPMEAKTEFGCIRLGERIYDLRAAGYDIKTSMVYGKDRFGEKSCHAVYTMEEQNAEL